MRLHRKISHSRCQLRSAGTARPKKQSLLSKLKDALIRVGSKNDDHFEKRGAKMSQSDEDLFPPEGSNEPEILNSKDEDDNISVISLGAGETRRLAPLRIDGVRITPIAPPSPGDDTPSTSTPNKLKCLPPIGSQKVKVKKSLKKGGKVTDSKSPTAVVSKQQSKEKLSKEKKTTAKKVKEQLKKPSKLKLWLARKLGRSVAPMSKFAAKEHTKAAELHKRINELEKKKVAKQEQLAQLKKGGSDSKKEAKKMTKSLKSTERKLRKLRSEAQKWEDKLKHISGQHSTIEQSGQAASGNRAVSDTNTHMNDSEGTTATQAPKVILIRPESTRNIPKRPCTAVRNFIQSCDKTATSEPHMAFGLTTRPKTVACKHQPTSDRTTITSRERTVIEMMRVEQQAREALYGEGERPSTVVYSRAQALAEGIQALVPADLECFEDEDFERGLPYCEQKPFWQRGGRYTPDENGELVWEWNLESDSEEESDEDDDYDSDDDNDPSFLTPLADLMVRLEAFEKRVYGMKEGKASTSIDCSTYERPVTRSRPQTRLPTRMRPPSRCTNAMAKQMLQERDL